MQNLAHEQRDPFWRAATLEDLARHQGVKPVERLEDVAGRGDDLWDDDADCDRFVDAIRERRRDGSRK